MPTLSIRSPAKGQEIPWSFLYSLRQSGLLDADQLRRLENLVDGCDMPTICGLILEMNWLTSFQLDRIVQGQGRGLIVGQYRLLGELGQGGFGKVYKAVHGIMDRVAALKFITQEWSGNESVRAMFLREVVATTRLTHPNIATAYDANETDGALWFAMEYVEGPTLEQFVDRNGPLPIPLACAIVSQAAQALQHAHELGMVHRDIKPANLLLPRGGRPVPSSKSDVLVKVVDFGLARLRPMGNFQPQTICQEGCVIGTPEYIAPEQARGDRNVDGRSDLYSLGCTLYFMLTGRSPFTGATPEETMAMHLVEQPTPVECLRPETPVAVAAITRRLMAKSPSHRFQTPTELIEALAAAMLPAFPETSTRTPQRLPRLEEAPKELPPPSEPLVEEQPVPQEPGPMPPPAQVPKPPLPTRQQLTAWRQWVGVVGSVARREPAQISEAEYKSLYEGLRRELRGDGDPADWRGRLAVVLEPWVTLRALTRLDPATIADLHHTCRCLDAELVAPSKASGWAWACFVTLLAASVAVGVFLVTRG